MTGDELISATRRELKDEVTPYLWSDETILLFLQNAELEFCRETHVLIESDITFDTIAGEAVYAMPSNVLHMYDVFDTTTGYVLASARGRMMAPSFNSEGRPTSYSRSRGNKTVVFYPTPDAVYSMQVAAAVRPSVTFGYDTEPQIDEEDHHSLTWYAAARCLVTNDVDGGNVGTADKFMRLWGRYLVERKRNEFSYRTGSTFRHQSWAG